jgi:hypothetical protein
MARALRERRRREDFSMGVRAWLLLGGLCGLVAGLILDAVVEASTAYLRAAQVLLVLFGAAVSAFVYEGAKTVTGGREPAASTDRPRRRYLRFARRAR